ncbi:MAG: MaoC/PaaZ C-terminal domain-containing protein [Myxococcota bacterium]
MISREAHIGQCYPKRRLALTPQITKAYALAYDDTNPRYLGDDCVAPPMVIVRASLIEGVAAVLSDPTLVEDAQRLRRVLHGEEHIRWYKVLRPNDILWTVAIVENIESKRSGDLITIATRITDQHNEMVCETRSLLFFRGSGASGLRAVAKRPARSTADRGTLGVEASWHVALDQALRYAQASGDHNPIHINEAAAKEAGLKGCVLQGLCSLAFAQRVIVDQVLGGDPAGLHALGVRFSRPVYPGDTLSCLGWWDTQATEEPDTRQLHFEVRNQAQRLVLQNGVATVMT